MRKHVSVKHKLYTVTLATAQELTVTLAGSGASFVEVVLFDGCDENACLAVSPQFSSVLPPVCLEPGLYGGSALSGGRRRQL